MYVRECKPICILILCLALALVQEAIAQTGRLSDVVVTPFSRTDADPWWFFPGYDYVALSEGDDGSAGLRRTGALHYVTGYVEHELPGPFLQAANGGAMTLAIQADGCLAGWKSGTPISVPAGNDYTQVAAGNEHQYALRRDGSILAWGWDALGQLNVPPGTFVQVAAGHDHGAALRSDGSIAAWGDNTYGQCNVPIAEHDFVAVAAGYYDTYALRADGTIAGWGDVNSKASPPSGGGFIDIRGSRSAAMALRSDGAAYYWGAGGIKLNPGPVLGIGGDDIIVPRRTYETYSTVLVDGTGADTFLNRPIVCGGVRIKAAMTWNYNATITTTSSLVVADPGSSLTLLLNGHTPIAGEFYQLSIHSIEGRFDSVNLPDIGPELGWDTSGLYSHGYVGVIAIPEPATLGLLALSAPLLVWRKKATHQ